MTRAGDVPRITSGSSGTGTFRRLARAAAGTCALAFAMTLASAASGTAVLAGQGIVVAPQSLILERGVRSASFVAHNPSGDATDVSITPVFGYPATDSAGALAIRVVEVPAPDDPSAVGWVSVFPKRMVLAPGERRTVRLLVRPPDGLADGEYWARLSVVARAAVPDGVPVPSPASDSARGLDGVSLEVQQFVAVLYRKGVLRTGLAMTTPTAVVEGARARVRVAFTPRGTAAFLGTLTLQLRDLTGRVVLESSRRLAVYRPIAPAFDLDLAGLTAGRYRVVVNVTTARGDIPPAHVLPAPGIRDSVDLVVPAPSGVLPRTELRNPD